MSLNDCDIESITSQDEENEGTQDWFLSLIEKFRQYWKKQFFRQIVRSSVVFVFGMKLLREVKGLDIFPAGMSVCPSS